MALWGEVITTSRPCTFNCERGKLDFVGAVLLSSSPVSVKVQMSDGPSWTLHRFDPSAPNQRFRLFFEEDVTFTCHPLPSSSPSSSSSSVEVQLLGNIVPHPRPLMDLSGSEDEEEIEGEADEEEEEDKEADEEEEEDKEEEEEEEKMATTADEEVTAAKKKEKTAVELPKTIEALGDQIVRKVNDAAGKRLLTDDKIEEKESQPMKKTKINKNNEKTKMMTATTLEAKNSKIEKSNPTDMEIKKNVKSNNVTKLPNKQSAPPPKQNDTKKPSASTTTCRPTTTSISSSSSSSVSSASAASLSSKTTTSSSSSSSSLLTEVKVGHRFEVRGVKCEVLEVGGCGKKTEGGVQTGKKIKIRYSGTLAKNGKRFDSGTLEFRVGAGDVIKGFDYGVQGMQIKEKRRVLIPSPLAYGKEGSPPVIPGNADLVFEITLLSISK